MNVTLPQSIGSWNLAGPAKTVEPKAIFDYMDGAGELYLGYRFKSLDVYEYKNPGQDEILVELYWMETSDDAWGLISGDWGGENLQLSLATGRERPDEIPALYGAGLLRLRSRPTGSPVLARSSRTTSRWGCLFPMCFGSSPMPRATASLPWGEKSICS